MGEVIAFPAREHQAQAYGYIAVGAEGGVPYANVSDVHEAQSDVIEAAPQFMAFNADSSPWLRGVRDEAREKAKAIAIANRQRLYDGDFESVPLEVDALGTAAKVAKISEHFGVGSPEHLAARDGLLKDCQRKWAEAFRKNAWEYFGTNTQQRDPVTGELRADGLSVDQMVGENGLSPLAEEEDLDRRENDFVGLHTDKTIMQHPAANSVAAVKIYPCPEWVQKAYEQNPNCQDAGYAPAIKKVMSVFTTYDYETQTLEHEQMGFSGEYITPEVIVEAQEAMAIAREGGEEDKHDITAIQGTFGVVPREEVEMGVVGVLQLLDTIASEHSGKNIFRGEAVADDFVKDYSKIYKEAEDRKQQQAALTEELAAYVEDLYARGIDHVPATLMVEKFIQNKLLKIVGKDPDQAEIVFNKETAEGFRQVHLLEAQGRYDEAEILRKSVELAAPPASSCGPGCGLEAVDSSSAEGKELAKKMGASADMEINKDKVRPCKHCNQMTKVYAHNADKVIIYCKNEKCDSNKDK